MVESAIYRNALAPKSRLHEYRLESVLGAGGFGVTYLAWDTNLEKNVAIKEYLPTELAMRGTDGSIVPLSTDAENGYKWGLERYIQEARTLARFSHPNIVRVNRYFEANGTGYMVMDYERGEPLGALLKRAPRLDEAILKRMLAPLLEGLRAVHSAGFLHRDIKPDNIFLRADGTPVLIDFGAARQSVGGATKTLTAVLTPGYAPLEQYTSGGHQGPWTDLYALAGVLYRAVCDEPPPDAVTRLKGDRVNEGLARARDRYSEPFLKALQWALVPDEKSRPQSVEDWQRALFGAPARAASAIDAPPAAASGIGAPANTSTMRKQDAATVRVTSPSANARTEAIRNATVPPRRTAPAPSAPAREGWPWMRALVLVVVAVVIIGVWHKHRVGQQRALEREHAAIAPPARAPVSTHVAAPVQATSASQIVAPAQPVPASPAAQGDDASASAQAPDAAEKARTSTPASAPALSEEQTQRLRREAEKQFRSADADGDGYLSPREVRAHFPYLAQHFRRIDTDGDGRISFDEFLAVRREQMERRLNARRPD